MNPILRLQYGMIVTLVFFLMIGVGIPALAVAAVSDQVLIEAANGVDYDVEKNITVATKDVKLTRGDLSILADKITYYGNTGVVEATGHVKMNNANGEYHTAKQYYNVVTSSGKLDPFTATLNETTRDFYLNGKGMDLSQQETNISNVGITRCPKSRPDYVLQASRVKIVGKKIQLNHVVLKLLGVPVMYLPYLSFFTDQAIPELEPGYNHSDGFTLKSSWMTGGSSDDQWEFATDLSSHGDDSTIGIENVRKMGNSRNRLGILYDMDSFINVNGWLKLSDTYTYETTHFFMALDGYREFSDAKKNALGVTLKRKYWPTSMGRWQVGVLLRRITALDTSDTNIEYGGTYSGLLLDYKPAPNITLSYMGLKSHSGTDYGDLFDDDFGLGNNWLYDINFPIKQNLKGIISGTYNSSESKWYHQIYGVSFTDCCFNPTVYYDVAEHSFGWKLGLKF